MGAARLSPEQTGKVGTAARPGNGDAVGQVAGEAGGWGRVEIGSAQQNRGESGPGPTQSPRVGRGPPWAPCRYTPERRTCIFETKLGTLS